MQMHKTKVYLAKSNDARSQDVNVVRSYLKLHDVEVVEHDSSRVYSNGPLLSSDYLVIIPAYNYVHDGNAAQRVSGKGIITNEYQINIGKGLYTQIMEFNRDKKRLGEINTFVYTGKDTLFRTITNIDTYGGTDWKQFAYIKPSTDVTPLMFLKRKEPAYNADFMIKLTGNEWQFCEPSYDSYRTIDGAVITYKGKSRIDNAPTFNVKMNMPSMQTDTKKKIRSCLTNWRFAQWAGCVSGSFDFLEAEFDETAATVTKTAKEAMQQLQDAFDADKRAWTIKQSEGRMEREPVRTIASELVAVQPMSKPSGTLHYYIDYIYEDKYRLLLVG
jgi:hypothetical protein